jgi:cell division protein FtsX
MVTFLSGFGAKYREVAGIVASAVLAKHKSIAAMIVIVFVFMLCLLLVLFVYRSVAIKSNNPNTKCGLIGSAGQIIWRMLPG